jgi:hypothetical protein
MAPRHPAGLPARPEKCDPSRRPRLQPDAGIAAAHSARGDALNFPARPRFAFAQRMSRKGA